MHSTSPYPSDLSDAEWALLEPLLESSERRGRPPKWPARRVANAVFYLLRGAAAPGGCCPGGTHLGRRCTTTSGSGAGTGGCAEPTTGFVRRCAKRKGGSATLAGP